MIHMEQRDAVARFMRRLYRQGLTTTSGGNVSVRVDDTTVAISASGSDKGELSADQVALMSVGGVNLTPELKPSIETPMHLGIYQRVPTVNAIVHAHPITASVFCASRKPINCQLLAESYAVVGKPVFVPYACMGSDLLATLVADSAARAVCLLLENHGVLTTGDTLLQAFDRLEVIEYAARATLLSNIVGGSSPLRRDQLREIDRLMGR